MTEIANTEQLKARPNEASDVRFNMESLPPARGELPTTEISNTEQLKAHLNKLNDVKLDLNSLQLLAGGNMNFAWRLLDVSGKSIIIKHAEPYVKCIPGYPMPAVRLDFERRAMMSIRPLLDPSSVVSVPEVYHYDPDSHILMIEDGGTRTLKDAYADPGLDISAFGNMLGHWLAGLHQRTKHTAIGDNQTGRGLYVFPYKTLASALEQYGQDPSLAEQIEQYGSLFGIEDECVYHGDFAPRNILINDQGGLTVIDWEMVRRGCGAIDVGFFAAEAHLLDHYRGGRGLLSSFFKGYRRRTGELDNKFLKRVAIHMGVNVVFWPRHTSWGTEQETAEMVGAGCELMKRALDGGESWLAGSLLNDLHE